MNLSFFNITLLICFFLASCNSNNNTQVSLIPMPQQMTLGEGELSAKSFSVESVKGLENEISFLESFVSVDVLSGCKIQLQLGEVSNTNGYKGAYSLVITDDIQIKAESSQGVYYALQTLKQLINETRGVYTIAKCDINDWPSFKVRGFMHDVGRNYMSVELLKQNIDYLAQYKYNYFHFHVTENEGWRLESKLFPEINSDEATSRKPGKYYSQKEFVEIVNYCADRHITLIPELDIPGHSTAFRKAFNFNSMSEDGVSEKLLALFDELCSLVPAEKMPYIHIGTDEVRNSFERMDDSVLLEIINQLRADSRRVIGWHHGINVKGDSTMIKQLWAQFDPLKDHAFIDSRSNYLNHIDPLSALYRMVYQQPCRQSQGDSIALGGVLCLWNDNYIEDEMDFFTHNPTYPSIVMYSEAVWRGVKDDMNGRYWAQMPSVETPEYNRGADMEERLIEHRNKYFNNIPFPYVKHSHIPWKIIGPFNHKGDLSAVFPPEKEERIDYASVYEVDNVSYSWSDSVLYGGTIHLKHFFGFNSPLKSQNGTMYATTNIWSPSNQEVGFWIGFHGWSRSGGRRGGPTPSQGQWHTTLPKIWVNSTEVNPPVWENPNVAVKSAEVPFANEDYFYRTPTMIDLQKGWNTVLVKIPHGGTSWKWMFTCVPVSVNGNNVREVDGLRFSVEY